MKKDTYTSMLVSLLFTLHRQHVITKKDKLPYYGKLYLQYKEDRLTLISNTRLLNLKAGRRILKHDCPSSRDLLELLPLYGFSLEIANRIRDESPIVPVDTKKAVTVSYARVELAQIQPDADTKN